MQTQLTKRFAHVFIHYFSNKSRSTTKLFVGDVLPTMEAVNGRIFGIIEINTPSRDNTKFLSDLIANIEQTYYSFRQNEITPLEAFEKTLKKVNDDFIQLLEASQPLVGNLSPSAYLDKMNVLVGVVYGTQLIVSSKNAVGAFLMRRTNQGYKLISVLDDENENSEGKLFSNIISGDIEAGDYLFFANNDFLNFISRERILKTVTSLDPQRAADYFKNSLLAHDGFNFAGIVVKTEAEAVPARLGSAALTSIGSLNAQENKTEKILSPTIVPNFISSAGKQFASLKSKAKIFLDKLSKQNSPAKAPVPTQSIQKPKFEMPKMNLPKFGLPEKIRRVKLSIPWQQFKSWLRLSWNKVSEKVNNIPHLSRVLFIIFLLCLGVFGYSVYFTKPQAFDFILKPKQNESLTKIESTLNEAESKLIYGDNTEAKRLLALAETDIASLKVENSQDSATAQSLISKLNALVAKIRQVTLITEPAMLWQAPTGPNKAHFPSIALNNDTLYVFDDASANINAINIRTKESTPISGNIKGNVVNANVIDKNVYFVTDTNNFYRIDQNNAVPISVALKSSELSRDFTWYNDKLYNLIPSTNQIYRHPNVGGNYDPGITWIQESGIDLSKANSIGIDTRIWVGLNDGQIYKFFKGQKQAFALAPIEPVLNNMTSMEKNESLKYIYVLDSANNRLVVFDENGLLKTQYFSEQLQNLTSFAVDENTKTIYLANGDAVYSIFMSHL